MAAVTQPAFHVVYAYSVWKLWLAYGIAILVSALAVIVGMTVIWLHGASHSNNFSAIFRTARGAQLSVKIENEDLNGQDPLPKYLEEATVATRDDATLVMYKPLGGAETTSAVSYKGLRASRNP